MMFRKFIRTAWNYKAQFISMILMLTIGIGAFWGFNISWYSAEKNVNKYIEDTAYADYRIYSEELFTKEDIQAIKDIKGIEAASRVLSKKLNIEDSEDVVSGFCLEDYQVSKMIVTDGIEYDERIKGIWLSDRFAKANGINVGDTIEVSYLGFDIDCEVVGMVKSMEYLVCIPDESQLMPDYEKYGFAYISPAKLNEELGQDYYPQINILSDLSKEELEDAIKDVIDKNIYITSMQEHISYRGARNEINDGKILGAVLPVFFLLIAILTMMTTMHRITENERYQIGTLKSMGYTDMEVSKHYMLYGLFSGLIGCVGGVAFGMLLVWIIISETGMISMYLDLPQWKIHIPISCYIVLILTILLQMSVCYYSVKKIVKGTVAGIFRPTEKKLAKSTMFEKCKIWQKLGFATKWNIRDIQRHKLRSIMSLIGVIGCMIMLIAAFGLKSSTDELIDFIDKDIYNYETKIDMSDVVSNERICEFADEYSGDWIASIYVKVNDKSVRAYIYDINNDTVRVVDPDDKSIELKDNGVYICTKMTDEIQVGDYINLSPYSSDDSQKVKVIGVTRSLMGENITMSKEFAESIGIDYHISSVYTNVSIGEIEENRIILDIQEKETIITSYRKFMNLLNIMVSILMICAILLGVVVLYNLGMMGYVERARELATLKVLGYRDSEITGILITQNLWITIIGILIGLPLGKVLLEILVKLLSTEYEMKAVIDFEYYLVCILITIVVSMFIAFLVASKNKHIDMAEALKENE